MRWPWISRRDYEWAVEQADRANARESEHAFMSAEDRARLIEAHTKEISLLNRELDYYRQKFDAEKDRADRAVDSLMQWAGREPISAPAQETITKQSKINDEMQRQTFEIFGEVAASVLGENLEDTEEDGSLPVPVPTSTPEELAEAIEARLVALRLLPRYQPKEKSASVSAEESSVTSSNSDTIAS